MRNTLFKAGSLTTLETRPALAGESLYALLHRSQQITNVSKTFNAALESHTFSENEQRVLLSSLRVLHGGDTAAMENYYDDVGEGTGFGGKVKDTLSSALSYSKDKIVQAGGSLKEGMQDFYDSRLNWYGALDKELEKLRAKADHLDGGVFVNKTMVSEVGRKKANKSFQTPYQRVEAAQQEAIKALMVADMIKNQSAAVSKALVSDSSNLKQVVDGLLNTIRSTSRQVGDECHWTWSSFNSDLVAELARSTSYDNLTAEDFSVKKISLIESELPGVVATVRRATADEIDSAVKYAKAAQATVENAIGKNNVDIWRAIANLRVDAEEQEVDQNKINGVTALIIFADKIQEYIAKLAQQSYFESVYTQIKWIDLSIKDALREQSRQTQ